MSQSEPTRSGCSSTVSKALIVVGLMALALFFVPRIEQFKKRQQATDELKKTQRETGDKMKADLDRDGSISADTAAGASNDIRKSLEKFAAGGGPQAKEMKALAEVIGELQAITASYNTLYKRLETENPMSMANVKTKGDLASRRALGREIIRRNDDILAFINTIETRLRTKLQTSGSDSASIEKFVKGFMSGFNQQASLLRRVRQCDKVIGTSLMAMADLLNADWGKWKVQPGTITFSTQASMARYNALVGDAKKAANDQVAAQREFVEYMQRK